jgi:putative transposase
LGLEIKIAAWKNQGKSISAFELMKQLSELRKDYPWIGDIPAQSLQAVLERLDRSYQVFFKGGGFPKWASKKKYRSIHIKSLKAPGHLVILPKIGVVRMFKDAPIWGTPKTAQIVIEPTGLFICIQCELPDPAPRSENQSVGLELGLSNYCVLSDGTLVENPRCFDQYRRRLRRTARSLNRKEKGSNSWKKQARALACLYHRMRRVRRDYLHKI